MPCRECGTILIDEETGGLSPSEEEAWQLAPLSLPGLRATTDPGLCRPCCVRILWWKARRDFVVAVLVLATLTYLYYRQPAWLGRIRLHHPEAIRITQQRGPDYYLVNSGLESQGKPPVASFLASPDGLSALLAYPIATPADVVRVSDSLADPRSAACPPPARMAFSDTFYPQSSCLIFGVVDVSGGKYEMRLLDFAKSGIRVLRVLREELRLPPPAGHAVVRLFEPDDPMPRPLHEFHTNSPEAAGASFGGPYIAVFQTDGALDEIIAHELVHAYLGTVMGTAAAGLPDWFHEGIALSLSRTPPQAVAGGANDLRLTTLTAQYREYKHVFDRVEARFGRERYLAVLRDCISRRSVGPLMAATDCRDYAGLVKFANGWAPRDGLPYLLVLAMGAAVSAASAARRIRRTSPGVATRHA